MTNLVDELINLLDLESIELNLFRGVSPQCVWRSGDQPVPGGSLSNP